MFRGWMSFAGVEIANAARTERYAAHLLSGLAVTDCDSCEDFHEVLGDKPYTTPFVDQPDWFDPDNPDTWNFLGYLPLSAQGVEDSTVSSSVTQLATDGAYAGRPRAAGREMRFTGVLIGTDDAGVQAGMTWLRHALEGDHCRAGGACTGDHFCYFAACPQVCEDSPALPANGGDLAPTYLCPTGELAGPLESCVAPYERHMYRVTCIDGPKVVREYGTECASMWEVEFTLMAGVPGPYGAPQWVASSDGQDLPSIIVDNVDCPSDAGVPPLEDPNCVVPLPPRPPLILDDCLVEPDQWRRYQVDIADDFIPVWSDAVPTIRIRTHRRDANQVRLRFYPNPFGRDVTNAEGGCNFCGEFLVSYIPKNSLLVIDGVEQTAWLETYDGATAARYGATRLSATHLLYGSDGGPMSWPLLSCGVEYSMTIDVVPNALENLFVSLCLSVRE